MFAAAGGFDPHTDRSDSQLSQVNTKNYSNAPRVLMGIWGLVYDPRTQIWEFGAQSPTFKRTRTKKPLKRAKFDQNQQFLGVF